MKRPVHLPNLDVARFVSALWVVLVHYLFVGPLQGWVPQEPATGPAGFVAYWGYMGVCLFFVVSGFVIVAAAQGRSAPGFLAARAVRIAPAFVVCATLSALILGLAGSPHAPGLAGWLANLTLLPQAFGHDFVDGVYWSLVYEVYFYLWMTAFLALGLLPSRLPEIGTAWLVVAAVDRFYLQSPVLERLFVTEFAGFFVAGMALHLLHSRRCVGVAAAMLAAAVVVAGDGVTTFGAMTASDGALLAAGPAPLPALLSAVAVVLAVVACLALPQARRFSSLAILLGGISYPLYLLHQELGYLALGAMGGVPAPLASGIAIAGAIALAWAVYRFAELPARRALAQPADALAAFLFRPLQQKGAQLAPRP